MVVSKSPLPIIGKLSELLNPGGNLPGSPRSPLDFRVQSPRGVKKYDLGGVGLGIVAALENSGDHRGRLAVRGSFLSKSSGGRCGCGDWDPEISEDEDYTVVICHGPEKSVTKVYYDGGEQRSNSSGPAKEPSKWFLDDGPAYPISDFLSSCHLCRKSLHGKDIYMYRGEGFCSPECRSSQIMMDERKERKCRSEVTSSEKVPISGHNAGQIFSTGILAI